MIHSKYFAVYIITELIKQQAEWCGTFHPIHVAVKQVVFMRAFNHSTTNLLNVRNRIDLCCMFNRNNS